MLEDQHVYFISDGAPFRAPVEALTAGDDPSGLPSSVGVFDVHEELGVGGFGRVMRGVNKMSREESVALKFLRKKDIASLTAANMLAMEIQCLSMMKVRIRVCTWGARPWVSVRSPTVSPRGPLFCSLYFGSTKTSCACTSAWRPLCTSSWRSTS